MINIIKYTGNFINSADPIKYLIIWSTYIKSKVWAWRRIHWLLLFKKKQLCQYRLTVTMPSRLNETSANNGRPTPTLAKWSFTSSNMRSLADAVDQDPASAGVTTAPDCSGKAPRRHFPAYITPAPPSPRAVRQMTAARALPPLPTSTRPRKRKWQIHTPKLCDWNVLCEQNSAS